MSTTSGLMVYDVTQNGVLPGSGSAGNNWTKLTALIPAAEATTGAILFFPAGDWYVDGALSITAALIVQGAGQGNTTIMQTGTGVTTFTVGGSGFVLQDITIDHSTNNNGIALSLSGTAVTNVHIDRVTINEGSQALVATNCNQIFAHALTVTMTAGFGSNYAIELSGTGGSAGSQELHFTDCFVSGPTTGFGVSLQNCSGSFWSGCHVTGFYHNVVFSPTPDVGVVLGGSCFNHYFVNCRFEAPYNANVVFDAGYLGTGYNIHDVRFEACSLVSAPSYGVYLLGADSTLTWVSGIDFMNCQIVGGSGIGVQINSYVNYVLIQGGTVSANTTCGVQIASAAQWLQIQNVAFGVNYPNYSTQQKTAIEFAGACTHTMISDCDCTLVKVGTVYYGGFHFSTNPAAYTSIVNCRGYNDQGSSWIPALSNGVNYDAPNVGDYYGPYLLSIYGSGGLTTVKIGPIGASGSALVDTKYTLGIYKVAPGLVVNAAWSVTAPSTVAIGL